MTTKPRTLTAKEQLFVAAYLGDARKNQTQAAIAAGYSERSAKKQGYTIMHRPHVKRAVTQALKEQSERLLMSSDEILLGIQRLAMKAEKRGQLSSARDSLVWLGKHFKLFTEKHEHGGIGGGPVQFQITPAEADH